MTNVKCISCSEVKTGTVVVASGLEELFLLNTININTKKKKKKSRKHQKRGNKVFMVCPCGAGHSEGQRALISPAAFGQTNSE